jgi:hypothetical protein
MAIDLAGFLHRKYRERVKAAADKDRDYSLKQFADDIGIEYKAFDAIYNKRGGSKMIAFDNLQALIRTFGREFTDEFNLTPGD